jgi:DNA replication and repair protein RecF
VRCDADAPVALTVAPANEVTLLELRLQNVRCLRTARLMLHPRVNLITGDNGAGKTSLLEAIYLLGRGRSFRTRHLEQLIGSGEAGLAVSGTVLTRARAVPPTTGINSNEGGSSAATGPIDSGGHDADGTCGESPRLASHVALQCDHEHGLTARVDGRVVESLAELAMRFPVQVIDPGIHRLIEEGPEIRRQWLDWAMFHVEPQFLTQWRSYRRALRQRNAALKAGGDATLWDGELQRFGDLLTAARSRLVERLQPVWAETARALEAAPATAATTLTFHQGWSTAQSLMECLARQAERDRERGMTTQGPHRFDVGLRVDGLAPRDLVSRGQQKLLGAAMALSMTRLLTEHLGHAPTLLLDDPAAELDPAHTRRLLAEASALGGQQIVTALRLEQTLPEAPNCVFHVERGEVKRL